MDEIHVETLEKSFNDTPVLSGVSFTVESGEVYGLLGPNGAGKTTTIELLTGVEQADAGTVSVAGRDPSTDALDVRDRVGVLPESESPPSFLTPREYFRFIGDVRDLDASVVRDRVDKWASQLSFTSQLDVLAKNLSRGHQQKVMLTQALLHEPAVVFIDEPVANLDPLMQERVKEFIRAYHADGNTVVLCTHQLAVAEALCTRVGVLANGTIAAEHVPADDARSLLTVFEQAVTAEDQ